jgi:hypothetical protein
LEIGLPQSPEELKSFLGQLDRTVLQKVLEWARGCYKDILERLDELIARCTSKEISIEGLRGVWYQTCLGPVRVTRRLYRDREGRRRYLLDELMGMGRYRHITSSVQELALEMASAMPFRRSAEVLRKASAIDLPHQSIWRLVARVADPYLEKARRELQWFLETGEISQGEGRKVARLIVEADGVMLSLQREKERKAEVKLGIAYEGWEKVSKDRYRTVNKTAFASLGGGDAFWAGMSLKLQGRYDLGKVGDTIVGGDGAGWIKDGASYINGRFQLDRYHLHRELCTALGKDRETRSKVWRAIEQGEIETGLRLLAEAKSQARGELMQRIAHAYSYLLENRCGLEDYRRGLGEEGKRLRRTGAIEGNVDKLVVRRMKNQGMSWSLKGIQRLLCLRFLVLEGKLTAWLSSQEQDEHNTWVTLPRQKIRHIVNRALRRDPSDWLNGGIASPTRASCLPSLGENPHFFSGGPSSMNCRVSLYTSYRQILDSNVLPVDD